MTKKLFFLIFLTILFKHNSYAAPVLNDFAYGFNIITHGNSSIYKLLLPKEIYSKITRTDMGDIRIFNSTEEVVPHTIMLPEKNRYIKTKKIILLPFFPLPKNTDTSENSFNAEIKLDNHGAIISVHGKKKRKNAAVIPKAYIIDLTKIKQPLSELELWWDSNGQTFVANITAEYSYNLEQWFYEKKRVTIADLEYEGHKLQRRTILLSSRKFKYLRLSWNKEKNPVTFTKIYGVVRPVKKIQKKIHSIFVPVNHKKDRGIYYYDTLSLFPEISVNLLLPVQNSVIQATLFSRADTKSSWKKRAKGLFYNLAENNASINNDPIHIYTSKDRFWQVKTETTNEIFDITKKPRLILDWYPHELFFMAQGNAPFTLAYGSGKIRQITQSMTKLIKSIKTDQKRTWPLAYITGKQLILGGHDQMKKNINFKWKIWILWSLMIIGVLMLGIMAWRLYKNMDEHGNI